jgi:hypothetical protein
MMEAIEYTIHFASHGAEDIDGAAARPACECAVIAGLKVRSHETLHEKIELNIKKLYWRPAWPH